jgi:transcriptional regulator with XRE-family HTH domain
MNNRIKEIRKDHHLTQSQFAERIGLKQNSIAQIEIGKRTPSEQVIVSICREFGIFREWLETGEGLKYKKAPSGGIEREIQDILGVEDPFAVSILSALAKMPPEFWAAWREELYRAVEAQKKSSDPG